MQIYLLKKNPSVIKSSLEQRDVLLQSKNLRNGLEYCSDLIIVNVIMQQDFLDI